MKRFARGAAVLVIACTAACHPLSCFGPSGLPTDKPLVLTASRHGALSAPVEVMIDDQGVPHISGKTESDLAYGIGFMHARDRLFQILSIKYAAEGRLTELFGKDLLEVDRTGRLLMHRLDEQVDALSDRDRALITAYVDGLNDGAKRAGRSAEMQIIGIDAEPFTVRDIVAIARLQSWGMSDGITAELTRLRISEALGADDPRTKELLADVQTGGVPIVANATASALKVGDSHATPQARIALTTREWAPLPQVAALPTNASSSIDALPISSESRALIRQILERFGPNAHGASNSWAVAKDKAAAGVPVIINDPHLTHSAPALFYLVHLVGDGFQIAGATFPGLPAVILGHGDHMAWGVTNSFADTQDIVVLHPAPDQDDAYLLDGKPEPFGTVKQTFRLGAGKDAQVVEETWQTTVFGPVLPPRYGVAGGFEPVDPKNRLAVIWAGFDDPAEEGTPISGMWDLARSQNVDEATAALEKGTSPAANFALGFTDGTIAYRLSGKIAVRASSDRVDFPRDGATRAAGWQGRLSPAEKPQVTNPAAGYFVAANQRVVENGAPHQEQVGFGGMQPYRAQRAHELLQAALAAGAPSTEALLAIQQDALSIEARLLAPVLGRHCHGPVENHPDDRVNAFCKAVQSFNGNFTKDSLQALPYARLYDELSRAVLKAHLGETLAKQAQPEMFTIMALNQAFLDEDATPGSSALFDDPATANRDGLDGFVSRALKPALDHVLIEGGPSASDWRWGKAHTLSFRGTLAAVPLIGFLFTTFPQEEGGYYTSLRAEGPNYDDLMHVVYGSGLRFVAEMSDPPQVRMVLDSGQSGHFGTKHLDDHYPLWTKGAPFVIAKSRAEVQKHLEGWARIEPAP